NSLVLRLDEACCEVAQITHIRLRWTSICLESCILNVGGQDRLWRTIDIMFPIDDLAEHLKCFFDTFISPGYLMRNPLFVHIRPIEAEVDLVDPVSRRPTTGGCAFHTQRPRELTTIGDLIRQADQVIPGLWNGPTSGLER